MMNLNIMCAPSQYEYQTIIYGNSNYNVCMHHINIMCASYRYIESNTGKSARQGNLRYPSVRFQSFADEARRVCKRLKSYPRVSEISLSCTFCQRLILFLTFISCFQFRVCLCTFSKRSVISPSCQSKKQFRIFVYCMKVII